MPEPTSTTPITFDQPYRHLIDGRMEASESTFAVINPSTAEPFADCPDASRGQLDRAVAAAQLAFATWKRKSWEERRQVLHAFSDALQANEDQLARLLTTEQGKPLADARAEIRRAAASIREICGIAIA